MHLGIACAVLLAVSNARLLLPRKVAEIALLVPAESHGFFVVPRSKSLAPGGRYDLVVPPDGICPPIPDDAITFLPVHDTRGRLVPELDEEENHPSATLRGIWFAHRTDSRGELYYLGTLDQMRRSLPAWEEPSLGFR